MAGFCGLLWWGSGLKSGLFGIIGIKPSLLYEFISNTIIILQLIYKPF